jgi:large subunit ribosomal protein L32e
MKLEQLEIRKKIKAKKPDFIRQDNPKRPKLGDVWRKPKGIHSKIRHHFKGRRKMPSPGYRSPVGVRGLHATGLEMIRISSPNDVGAVSKESQGIIIPKTVGKRKKAEILKKARDAGVQVLNHDILQSIKNIEDFMASKKKNAKEEKKPAKKEPAKDKDQKKADLKDMTADEKKEAEKKTRDKVLTKKA